MASTSTEDLPNWAGTKGADLNKLTISQRKKLMTTYRNNKSNAKRKRSHLASCKDDSFVQKLDPRYVTNCCFNFIYIAYSQYYFTSNFCTVSFRTQ